MLDVLKLYQNPTSPKVLLLLNVCVCAAHLTIRTRKADHIYIGISTVIYSSSVEITLPSKRVFLIDSELGEFAVTP